MGFLTGAYGKLMAGKAVRDLQHRLTSVSSQLRRATKDVGNMEKMLASEQRAFKQNTQMSMQGSIFGLQQKMAGNLNSDDYNIKNAAYQEYNMMQQAMQMEQSQQMSMLESNFEMYKEQMMEPIKDFEEQLQIEKDNVESQLSLAKQDYEAQKEQEKGSLKDLKPEYNGGQG